MRESFEGLGLGPDDVDLIVVTDAQEILGIGDWGVNGIDICVGKLAVYTGAAGIHPGRSIAVGLDCGTDNQVLLNDPLYLGNRHSRTTGKAYDDFIALYLQTVSEMFPNALYHFEDFGPSNARRILDDNAGTYRIFNDDVAGHRRHRAGFGHLCVEGHRPVVPGPAPGGLRFGDRRLRDRRRPA